MRRTSIASLYLVAVGVAVTGLGVYGGFASLRNVESIEPSFRLWDTIIQLLLVGWIIADSRGRQNIYRPFCLGFLLLVFLLPYTPYYLVKTRGLIGLLWIAGALALFFAGAIGTLFLAQAS